MHRPRGRRRGVSPIIGTLFLIGMTIVAGVSLWTFRVQLPSSSVQIWYNTVSPATMQPWEDGSDCKKITTGTTTTIVCAPLPAIDIVVTTFSPSYLPIAALQFYFTCEGTVYLSGTLAQLAIVPGSNETIGAGGSTPTLAQCGNYTPPTAAFNRFMFFQQMTAGDPNLEAGDQIVISAQGYSPSFCAFAPSTLNTCWLTAAQNSAVQANSKLFPSTCPAPGYAKGANPAANGSYGLDQCDDDYHGVPTSQCYTVAGACEIDVAYTSQPSSLALRLPLLNLFPPGG